MPALTTTEQWNTWSIPLRNLWNLRPLRKLRWLRCWRIIWVCPRYWTYGGWGSPRRGLTLPEIHHDLLNFSPQSAQFHTITCCILLQYLQQLSSDQFLSPFALFLVSMNCKINYYVLWIVLLVVMAWMQKQQTSSRMLVCQFRQKANLYVINAQYRPYMVLVQFLSSALLEWWSDMINSSPGWAVVPVCSQSLDCLGFPCPHQCLYMGTGYLRNMGSSASFCLTPQRGMCWVIISSYMYSISLWNDYILAVSIKLSQQSVTSLVLIL